MNKILYTILVVLAATYSLSAQVTIAVSVSSVSVDFTSTPCDLDGLGAGDTDPEWDATVSDNRTYDEDFRHEITTNFDATVTGGYDNPLTFSQNYTTVCPPNFLFVEWSAYDDDAVGTDANTGTQNVTLPIVSAGALILGTNNYSFSAAVGNCGGTTWSITFSVTVSGSAPYFCSDTPCDASPQIIQDGCDNTIVITRYDVSNSTSTFSAASTTCGKDGNNDIFFSFVAPASGEIVMNMDAFNDFGALGTLTDLTINLYEGPCTSLVLVDTETYSDSNGGSGLGADCVDLSGGIFNDNYSPIYFENLTPGQTYFIRMTEEDDQNAYADLAFEAIVENNDCVNATELAGTTVYSGCNYNATDEGEPDDPNWTGSAHTGTFGGSPVQTCGGWASNENAVWYYFDVTDLTEQPITLDVLNVACEGGANTLQMGVWYAGPGPAYACDLSSMPGVGCDVGTGSVSVTLGNDVPNGRYYVMLDGNAGAQCVWDFQSPQILKIEISPKVFLQGPLSGTVMGDDLRTAGLLPATEPYTALGYTFVGGGGGETVSAGVFSVSGTLAVVDWVVVELRDGTTPTTIVESRAALLLANGDVVEVDGVSAISFNAPSGTYHLAIRHRNHLAVMTGTPLSL